MIGVTFREACACEIDMMVRGHVAHEAAALIPLAEKLRAMPVIEDPEEMILAATQVCFDYGKEQTLGTYARLMTMAGMRVYTAVERKDPMRRDSDQHKWWPRAA